MAASQCPKCSHLFEVRDGFGELLPLAYCSSCESYYPAHVGSCKWCGTKPEPEPRTELPWRRIAVGGVLALAWIGWMRRDPKAKITVHPGTAAQTRLKAAAAPSDTLIPVVAEARPEPVLRRDTLAAGTLGPTVTPATDLVAQAPATPANVTQPAVASAPVAGSPPDVSTPSQPNPSHTPRTPSKTRLRVRWASFVARNWMVVRADARRDAHVVASIGPESRVQLGETKGPWRRIRSRDIAGWVDASRAAFVPARSRYRSGGLASR